MAALDLALTEEQALLLGAVQRLTANIEQPTWDELAGQLGLAGLTVPMAQGGFGGGVIEIALVMAELGPALAGAGWLAHAAACRVLGNHPTLADLVDGTRRAALVCAASAASLPQVMPDGRIEGTARLVAGGGEAALFVVTGGDGVWVVTADAPGLSVESHALHDGTQAADLHFAAVSGERLEGDIAAAEALVRVGRCAEAVGLMQRMLADTAGYINQRRQFGAPLASFQALRHRLADMQLAMLQAQALTEAAVVALDRGAADQAAAVAAACVAVRDGARAVGEGAVQLHGAMGLTEELRLGARFKRLVRIASDLGSEAKVLAAFAEA